MIKYIALALTLYGLIQAIRNTRTLNGDELRTWRNVPHETKRAAKQLGADSVALYTLTLIVLLYLILKGA